MEGTTKGERKFSQEDAEGKGKMLSRQKEFKAKGWSLKVNISVVSTIPHGHQEEHHFSFKEHRVT